MMRTTIPALGTIRLQNKLDDLKFNVSIESDTSNAYGRLFIEIDGKCCDLDISNSEKARFLQNGFSSLDQSIENGFNPFTINFDQPVLPCTYVPSQAIAYIIPVITNGAFIDGSGGTRPETSGRTLQGLFWAVQCP